MDTYIECCKCGHQWKTNDDVVSPVCEKCGGQTVNLEMGCDEPPEWWVGDEKE